MSAELLRIDVDEIAARCEGLDAACGPAELAARLGEKIRGAEFQPVLSRGGWHRIGGVVDAGHARVAPSLDQWAWEESGGDIDRLLVDHGDDELLVTRIEGITHYLSAPCGHRACDFVQVEVEDLQEVVERPLIDPAYDPPGDVTELIEPLEATRLEPEPIGLRRRVVRRVVRIPDWLELRQLAEEAPLARFFEDWERSTAGGRARLCRHWVLALREWTDDLGDFRFSAKPVPALQAKERLRGLDPNVRGPLLSGLLHAFDRKVGYPFAWYFQMLATTDVSFSVAEAVLDDLAGEFVYLAAQDVGVLRAWAESPYST